MVALRSLLLRCLVYHPGCASKEGGLFLYGAATPPVQEGKFADQHIFLRISYSVFRNAIRAARLLASSFSPNGCHLIVRFGSNHSSKLPAAPLCCNRPRYQTPRSEG